MHKKEDVVHLKTAIERVYRVSVDWEGKTYIKLNLDWDYVNGKVTISLPGYIKKVLERFQHKQPKRPQDAPHPYTVLQYGRRVQPAITHPD